MAGLMKVITGEMFSGKSQELARLVMESLAQGHQVQVFYPSSATRGSDRDLDRRLPPHPRLSVSSVPPATPGAMAELTPASADVVAVDEAQFFSKELVNVAKAWRREGKLVLIGGLDQDYLENPFGYMGDLMCIANEVVKFHAFCAACQSADAFVSHRVSSETGQVVVGESNYVPLCQDCYLVALEVREVPVFVD